MTFNLRIDNIFVRISLILLALITSGFLSYKAVMVFLVGQLTDDRIRITRDELLLAGKYIPDSPRINWRLAETELLEYERDLDRAESSALKAVGSSPRNYRFWLTLASVREAADKRELTEESLRTAIRLAPNFTAGHWRLANLLIRTGRIADSLAEFRTAISTDKTLHPATLDLIWRVTKSDVASLESITPEAPESRLALASFLLNHSKIQEAADVFRSVDRNIRLESNTSSEIISNMISQGKIELAKTLWLDTLGETAQNQPLIWNGGFEKDILKNFAQFDWSFSPSEYARIGIGTRSPRTGSRALRIEFNGKKDTARLDGEIRHLLAASSGAQYTLNCFIKTEGLVTTKGPQVVITDSSSNWIAASPPIAEGTTDWKQITLEFTVPQGKDGASEVGLYLSIKRKPDFSYDDPTRGSVWFDDFEMIKK